MTAAFAANAVAFSDIPNGAMVPFQRASIEPPAFFLRRFGFETSVWRTVYEVRFAGDYD
ncbi:MAG TPA: hypothetical protein VK479_07005 [Micropepsaceae bacterium]|nr:hypothetical protein [Micropepsaceae bacterium]